MPAGFIAVDENFAYELVEYWAHKYQETRAALAQVQVRGLNRLLQLLVYLKRRIILQQSTLLQADRNDTRSWKM